MKNAIYIILSGALIASCTEPIDLDLNKGDNLKLVVDAWIDNSDRDQFVFLSLTTDYFDATTPTEAVGAEITLSGGGTIYYFEEISNGRYKMDGRIDGSFGTEYELLVNYQGESYGAKHILHRVPDAEFTSKLYEGDDDDEIDIRPGDKPIYDFFVTTQEPEGEGDNFFFNNFLKGESPLIEVVYSGYTTDEFIDGAEVNEAYVCDGMYEVGDTAIVQMRSISRGAIDYIFSLSQQTVERGFIFDTPPANLETNISGDAHGYFIMSAITEQEVVIQ